MKAARVLLAMTSLTVLAGCVRPKWEDMTQVAALASQISTERAHELFDNSFEIHGTVIEVDEHPLTISAGSGARAFTYHVQYDIQDPEKDPGEQLRLKTYILQITRHSFNPMFRIGDDVVLNGWLEKSADECTMPEETEAK